MSKTDKEVSLTTDDLTTIIPAIVSIQKSSLKDWCERNNWSALQSVQLQFYAIPPGGYIPVPLPKAAFALSDEYQQVFDTLLELQLLERVSKDQKDKALISNIFCFLMLCLNELVKNTNSLRYLDDFYLLVNLFFALSILIAITNSLVAISVYWEECQCRTKLSRMPRFVDLVAKMKLRYGRSIY